MWELDYKESWALKNWCFWTVVLEKTLESPLECKEIQPVHPKGNQLWIFIGRTDAETEIPILWPPDAKNWLIWKDPDAGKDWRWEEKGTTEDKLVGGHDQLNGHEFEEAQTWDLGYSFIIKGKVGKVRKTSLSFLSRCHASIFSSSFRLSRGVFLSLYGLARSTNYCFLMCAESMSYGSLTYRAHWAGYGSHAIIVLLFGGMSHASVA